MSSLLMLKVPKLHVGGPLIITDPKYNFGDSIPISLVCNLPSEAQFLLERCQGTQRGYVNIDLRSPRQSMAVYFEVTTPEGHTFDPYEQEIIQSLGGPVLLAEQNTRFEGILFGQHEYLPAEQLRLVLYTWERLRHLTIFLGYCFPQSTSVEVMQLWIFNGDITLCPHTHFMSCLEELASIEDPPPAASRIASS